MIAAEARCIPKQTSNDEGSAQDLQIDRKRTRGPTAEPIGETAAGSVTVDIQDNAAAIVRFPEHAPELKWDK